LKKKTENIYFFEPFQKNLKFGKKIGKNELFENIGNKKIRNFEIQSMTSNCHTFSLKKCKKV